MLAVLAPREAAAAEVATERTAPAAAPPNRWERAAIAFFALFLLVFPKGGVKLGGVPITWGYLGFVPVLFWFVARMLGGRALPVARTRRAVLALLLPFQRVSWLAFVTHGVDGLGFAISFLVTFFVVPPLFVLVFGAVLDRIALEPLLRWVRRGVLFIAAYGIFLFFYKLGTGRFLEIPLLTVNLGDLGELEGKHIDRGGIFKLISTYNNGNIYGISVLILLPLYCWLEPRWTRRSVVKFSLVLTLSRTVWAGLIAFELLWRVFVERVSLRAVAILSTSLLVVGAGIWFALDLMGREPAAFLLDRNLGGRLGQLQGIENVTLLPGQAFTDILEIVYISVLDVFGLVGLAAFLLAMAGPLLLYWAGALPHAASTFKRSLALGLVVYLIVAASDGALLYIPVMAFYWFTASLLLSDNPSFIDGRGPVCAQRKL
jgi:hypothetical protein